MGEFDSPSTHSHLQPHQPFTIGSEVEVTINEEGFRGALFRATILKLRTSIFPSKKKKAVVQYLTLVTEDGSNPLKEQVDAVCLRPIPPDIPDIAFEECDIVDAVDKDGWWTGVVSKVLENGGYSVFFKNPMHVMEFQRNQLRLHQDWIDGKWVIPKKMGASILKDQLASRSICDKKYASFALASIKRRRGLSSMSRVSDPVKVGGRNVRGASIADGLKKTGSTSSSGKSLSKDSLFKRGRKRRIYQTIHSDGDSDLSDKFNSPTGGMKTRTKKDVDGIDELKVQGARYIDGNGENTFERSHCTQTADKDGKENCDVLETTPKEVSTNNESERNKHLASEENQMTKSTNNFIHLPDVEETSNNKTKEKAMELEQQLATKNSSKRMRGRPRRLIQGAKQGTKKDVESEEQGAQFINGYRGSPFERSHCSQTTDRDGKKDCDLFETTPKEVSTNSTSERNKHLASEEKQMTTPANNSIHLSDEVRGGEENSNNKTREKAMEPKQQQATEISSKRIRGRPRRFMQEDPKEEQQQASKNSYKRKRGRPRRIVPTTAEGKEQDEVGWKPDKETTKSCVTDFTNPNRNLNELLAFKTNDVGTKSASSNIDDEDRPLLMWLGGMQGPASKKSFKVGQTFRSTAKWKTKNKSEQVDGVNTVRAVDGTLTHQVDGVNAVRTIDQTPDHVLNKNQGWPFVKNSPFWRAIDELEVFKAIPQTPHFHPLSTHNKDFREGLAIGYMINFSNLVEDISKLQFDTPRQIFETTLASLSELEEYGFNVSMLCNRVNELLCIKDTQMRYLEESKEVENKILELTEIKTKLGEENKIIKQKIEDLQERQSSIKLEMETKDLEITRLQSHVDTIQECIKDTQLHFEKQTVLPL